MFKRRARERERREVLNGNSALAVFFPLPLAESWTSFGLRAMFDLPAHIGFHSSLLCQHAFWHFTIVWPSFPWQHLRV